MVKCCKCGLLSNSLVRIDDGDEPVCLWTKEKIKKSVDEHKCKHYMIQIPDLSPEAHYKIKSDEKQTNETYWIAIISIILASLALLVSLLKG